MSSPHRRALKVAAIASLAAVAAGCGISATSAGPAAATTTRLTAAAGAPCLNGEIAVRFLAVPGSAGAGNIVYALQVRNISHHVCSVTGLPRLQLLDAHGKALPTHQIAAHPGQGTAVFVPLDGGEFAWAAVRFSPDVPGPGEQQRGPCERTAAKVRATVGTMHAVAVGPIAPPTPVCSKGRLAVDVLSRVKPTG